MGGLAGAGLVWMATTKKGRAVRDDIMDRAADVYTDIKKTVVNSPQYKKMTKKQYIKMVIESVNKYTIKNGLADNIKKMMISVLSSQWSRLKKEMGK